MTKQSRPVPASGATTPALVDAAAAVLSGILPGQQLAPRSAIDKVLVPDPRAIAGLSPVVAVAHQAALVWCLLHSGQHAAAVDLAERDTVAGLARVAGQAPSATQSASYSVIAEANLLNGQLREGAERARLAREYAEEANDDGCRFRALGLLALAQALAGEIRAAAATAQEAKEVAAVRGWTAEQNAWPLLVAVAVVKARGVDLPAVQAAHESLDRTCGNDLVAQGAARFANILLLALRQDNEGIVAQCRVLAQGIDARLTPPLFIDLAVAMESVAHVHLGDPGAALAVLGDRESPRDHSVCLELCRATVYLLLGDLRKVLRLTDGCVTNPEHTVGTLASVHLRRSLAYEGLGLTVPADTEYSKAVHLAYETGALSAGLGIPLDIQKTMFARFVANEPEFAAGLPRFEEDGDYPDRAPLDFEPHPLTEREQVLATWLQTDLSVPKIAAALQVSPNTVKSQLRALYKKLSTSSRDEAVLRLERMGAVARTPGGHPDTMPVGGRIGHPRKSRAKRGDRSKDILTNPTATEPLNFTR